jgi:TonB-dependent SusC/RagA subfamily outer membrane receptor
MKELIQYQIEVAVCLATLSMLYVLLWRKETNFKLKRFLLLSIPILSFIIPLINLEINWQPAQKSNTIQYITFLPGQLELVYAPIVAETVSGWEIAFWIFITGAFIMMARLLVSYYKIWQIFHRSVPDQSGKYRLIECPNQSFSFFNLIMINRRQALSDELDYIFAHEKAHSRQGHSYDVLSLEILKMLHWFNPLIWLISRESRQNLEYLADREVAASTNKLENYQYAIVHHATQSNYQLLKTQFSKSNLKNRIVMMNQPNNRNIKSGKLIALIPVIALLFMSFSLKIENLDIGSSNAMLFEGVKASSLVTGTVSDQQGNPVPGCNILIKGTTVGTITNMAGEFSLKLPDGETEAELVFSFVGYETQTRLARTEGLHQIVLKKSDDEITVRSQEQDVFGNEKRPLFIVDGVEKENFNTNSINPNDIESISVLKDSSATIAYGEKGKNGAVLIKTKKSIGFDIGLFFDELPKYKEGEDAFYIGAIQKEIKYPAEARNANIQGLVNVSFTVTKDGKITNIETGEIKNSSGVIMNQVVVVGYLTGGIEQRKSIENYPVLADEVIRVLKTLGDFEPGKKDSKPVDVRMTLPVSFRLQ